MCNKKQQQRYMKKDELLAMLKNGQEMSTKQQIKLTTLLSIPAILAHFSSILMQYIDAAMLGRLGENEAAAVGLVSGFIWMLMGFCVATSSGFSVQVARFIGANDNLSARKVLRQALTSIILFSCVISLIGISLKDFVPKILGGEEAILKDASDYLLLICAFIPFIQLNITCSSMLQSCGNMKIPGILNVLMCILDVIFNYFFIFEMDMGVKGAAWGTGLAEIVTTIPMLYFLVFRSKELKLTQEKASFLPSKACLNNAFKISSPIWLQNAIMRGAYVFSMYIVAPLGAISIAANSFAITAESFCYMPGFGIAEAATALIGQSLGAQRKSLAKKIAKISLTIGALLMSTLAVIMYFSSKLFIGIMTPNQEVIIQGAEALKIVAFAETLFAVSIVGHGICTGAGDTLISGIINFSSMWLIRIPIALYLTPLIGLKGYWIAMCIELNIKGLLYLWRLRGNAWMQKNISKV